MATRTLPRPDRRSRMARVADSGVLGCCTVFCIVFGVLLLFPGIIVTLQSHDVVDIFPLPANGLFAIIGPVALCVGVLLILTGVTLCSHISTKIKRRDSARQSQNPDIYSPGHSTTTTSYGTTTQLTTFPSAPYAGPEPVYHEWGFPYPAPPPPGQPSNIPYGSPSYMAGSETGSPVVPTAPPLLTRLDEDERPPSYDTVMKTKR